MPLRQLKAIYEKRRASLVELLDKGGLDASRQHQIYGAVCEIDMFLKTIENLREEEIADNRKLDQKAKKE